MAEESRQPQGPRSRAPTVYRQWQAAEGIPSYTGSYVADLYTAEVAPWARTGQKGAFVNLAAQELDDGQILEIAPRGDTEVQHHLYEAIIYVLDGRGATTIWQKDGPKQTVEWQRGSLFSPPLNTYYQHFNLDGDKPARLYAATTAPATMNLLRDTDFIFDAPYTFASRYNAEDGYFSSRGERTEHGWKTNFIPDLRAFELEAPRGDMNTGRGAGGRGMGFLMSDNACSVHISEFPPGTYKKAHRHGAGAHVIILGGEGYSMLHFEGKESERIKADWKDGSMFSPQHWEYHQHFNTGPTPARYLACTFGRAIIVSQNAHADTNQIEYEDQDPEVHELYERECAARGAEVVLPRPAYAAR